MGRHNLIETDDGSWSIYDEVSNASFHSLHGALTESLHVYIEAGLNHFFAHRKVGEISIFEMGFGTGLNALLALEWAQKKKVNIFYHAIEKYPISADLVSDLTSGFSGKLRFDAKAFRQMHTQSTLILENQNCHFELVKEIVDIENVTLDASRFDVIFFDAFGPGTQPELWESGILRKMYAALKDGGILTTFCAQGAFKRTLKSLDFIVESLPGPPGKREMTRARKVIE